MQKKLKNKIRLIIISMTSKIETEDYTATTQRSIRSYYGKGKKD